MSFSLTQQLFGKSRPSPFRKKTCLPRPPHYRVGGVPIAKDKIDLRNEKIFTGKCMVEMNAMLSCLKKSAFEDTPCELEITTYNKCMADSIAADRELKKKENRYLFGEVLRARDHVPPTITNDVLKRYPQKSKPFDDVK